MNKRILLLSSAFSGLTQKFYTSLVDAKYDVSVELHNGNMQQVIEGVDLFKPDLIICPFLTKAVPRDVYEKYTCLIVHPGIEGDRGASSLDWAITENEKEWGVTLLEAAEEMDAGDIWANQTFNLPRFTKSAIFNNEVSKAALNCLWEALKFHDDKDFKARKLDYSNSNVRGKLRPLMAQENRKIDWELHSTDEILMRIKAADGRPGLLDNILGKEVYLHNVSEAKGLSGKAGKIIATANNSICIATIDGAIWIGHLREKDGIKLPSIFVLKSKLSKKIKNIEIDYFKANKQLSCQEVYYTINGQVAYIYFDFHNGAMSTEQCKLLTKVYKHVATLDINVIVLKGGNDIWSNGIHLNHIQHAVDPADESWKNINAINDLILEIINTVNKITIASVCGGAGAGGAILALAADKVVVRKGIILNPHYKNMGGLYGSEYWTYLLPKRVGQDLAELMSDTNRLPISSKQALLIGLIDEEFDSEHKLFHNQVKQLANSISSDKKRFKKMIKQKLKTRTRDEINKPLQFYRDAELERMKVNFYNEDDYHMARYNFVYRIDSNTTTPLTIAKHRRVITEKQTKKKAFSF